MAPRPPAYLIFAGLPDAPALLQEVAYSLEMAERRMREIAEQKPGAYFIRNLEEMVLDGINTAPQPTRPGQSRPVKRAAA